MGLPSCLTSLASARLGLNTALRIMLTVILYSVFVIHCCYSVYHTIRLLSIGEYHIGHQKRQYIRYNLAVGRRRGRSESHKVRRAQNAKLTGPILSAILAACWSIFTNVPRFSCPASLLGTRRSSSARPSFGILRQLAGRGRMFHGFFAFQLNGVYPCRPY
jgi:hypothetical protein